jgi:HEAT repeat protein
VADDRRDFGRFLSELRLKDLEGRKALIAELRRRKGERSVSLLLEILCDESWYLRELAVEALGEMGDMAVGPLLSLLSSGLWYSKSAAARTLGRIGDPRALRPLVGLLDDANQTVAAGAAEGLLSLSARGLALAVARALYARGPEFRERALTLVRRTHPDDARRLATLLGDDAWMNALGALSEETADGIVAASDDSREGLVWSEIAGRLSPPRLVVRADDVGAEDAAEEEEVPGDAPARGD